LFLILFVAKTKYLESYDTFNISSHIYPFDVGYNKIILNISNSLYLARKLLTFFGKRYCTNHRNHDTIMIVIEKGHSNDHTFNHRNKIDSYRK